MIVEARGIWGNQTRGFRVPFVRVIHHNDIMIEVMRLVLASVVAITLMTIVAFGALFVAMMLWTVRHPQKDPVVEDLDRVLLELLGPRQAVE